MINSFDYWVRLLNTMLGLVTLILFVIVIWRISARMRWPELLSCQGIAVILAGAVYRNQFLNSVIRYQYGFGVFIYTLGFTVTSISLFIWLLQIPRRRWCLPTWLHRFIDKRRS